MHGSAPVGPGAMTFGQAPAPRREAFSDPLHLNGVGHLFRDVDSAMTWHCDGDRAGLRFDRDPGIGDDAGVTELRDDLRVGLHMFGQPTHDDCGGSTVRKVGQPYEILRCRGRLSEPELFQSRNGIAVRRRGRIVQHGDQATLHLFAHDVLPPARFGVYVFPAETDDIDEQALGETVLAHHRHGEAAPLLRQLQMAVTCDRQQAVTFHPCDSLTDGGTALLEAFCDTCPQGHHALFFQIVDRPEVHLRGVDQILHTQPLRRVRFYR